MSNLIELLNEELSAAVDSARRSLVQVHVAGRHGRANGAGAGTIIHPDGLIITNAHVVRRQSPAIVLWDGRELDGRLLAYDEDVDLAAVSVDAHDLPALPLRNGSPLQTGQWVVALGHPWGVTGATTAGMVIAVGRPEERLPFKGDLIQVGLHLRPGHSGGPMLDSQGHLVGINTMISGPQVGLAIPVNTVKKFLKQTFA
jgi:S1-C subfamily serine protease